MREMGQSAWLSTSLHNLQGLKGRSQCNGDRSCHLWFAYSGKTLYSCRNFMVLDILNNRCIPSRTLKKTRLLTHLTQTPTSPTSLRLLRQSLRPRTRLSQAVHSERTRFQRVLCQQEGHLADPPPSFLGCALREHGNRPSYPAVMFSTLLRYLEPASRSEGTPHRPGLG